MVDISSSDLSGSPPIWLAICLLKRSIDSQKLGDLFHIQENVDTIRCTPKQLINNARDTTINDLKAGVVACISLQTFWGEFSELFSTFEDARRYIESVDGIDILDSFAVSEARLSELGHKSMKLLQRNGYVDLSVSD